MQRIDNAVREALPFAVGGTAVSNPIWFDWIQGVWQVGVAVAGAYILYLTIKDRRLSIRQREKDLSDRQT